MVELGSAINRNDRDWPEGDERADLSEAVGEIPLSNFIFDTEEVYTTVPTIGDVTRIADGEQQDVDTTAVAVTDRRLLFVTESDTDIEAVTYADIATVSVVERDETVLDVATVENRTWQVPVTEGASTGAVIRHLSWTGSVRSQLISCRNDIELAAGQIRDHASDMNWEEATTAYETAREKLDDIICEIQATTPVEDHRLAPELTEMERILEDAHTRLYIERSESQIELGRHLAENGDYEQARKVLQNAYEYYERARIQSQTVERADAFQFGAQRELQGDLERLGWEIETVAAEPVRQAHVAKIQAQNATDDAEAIEHWESAFRRYGNVLTLEWKTGDRYFAGDREKTRAEMQTAAHRLVELRTKMARSKWNEGTRRYDMGEVKPATSLCLEGTEHLERAHELATEFSPAEKETLQTRLERMKDVLTKLRNTATVERPQEESDPEPDTEATEEPTEESEIPTAPTISDIDTHHEITMELKNANQEHMDDQSEGESRAESEQEESDQGEAEPELRQSNGN